MRIGITYDLKGDPAGGAGSPPPGSPDDVQEEYDSPATIDAIAGVLHGLGHEVFKLGDGRRLLVELLDDPPDFVFNLAEGEGVGRCREARVPAVLEMLGIPYTGSDPLTLSAALDKDVARRLVAASATGCSVPAGRIVGPDDDPAKFDPSGIDFPCIIKPAWEGSSKGIRDTSLADTPDQVVAAVAALRRDYRQPVLVEQFIAGDEVTVGVLGNRPAEVLGVMRVVPTHPDDRFVYSLDVKRDWRARVHYECPAGYPPDRLAHVARAALDVFRVLGCRDVARIDFRVTADRVYFLEVNPLPGLTPGSSDLVLMGQAVGTTYPALIERILRHAVERHAGK